MKWIIQICFVLICALMCRAEVDDGAVSAQGFETVEETSKSTTDKIALAVGSNILPELKKTLNLTRNAIAGENPMEPTSEEDLEGLNFNDPNFEDGQKVLEEKCRQLGGEAAVEEATLAKDRLVECAGSLINVTQLQGEIDANKRNGELDTVFKKHCRKVPIFQECLQNFTNAIDPCLKDEERVTKSLLFNATDAMLGFICYKEGDRIALFIAEGGPDCMMEKQNEVKNCLNSTLHKHLPKQMPEAENLPSFVLEEAQCLEINEMQDCIVKHLENCKEPTPANIVESMMNYLKKSSPCAKYMAVNSSPSVLFTLAQTVMSSLVVLSILAFK